MTRTAVWQSGPWNRTLNRRILNWAVNRSWCKCGHAREPHQHFRPGLPLRWRRSVVLGHCGLCACLNYRKRR